MELKNIIKKERNKQRAYLSEPEEEWNHSYIRGTVAAFDTVLELLKKASYGVLDNVSDQRELLISFMEFRDKVYWGENEFTENDDIIDLWLKRNE